MHTAEIHIKGLQVCLNVVQDSVLDTAIMSTHRRLLYGEIEYPVTSREDYLRLIEKMRLQRALNLSDGKKLEQRATVEILVKIDDFNFLPKPAYSILREDSLIPLSKHLPTINDVSPAPHFNISPGTKITLMESITPDPAGYQVSIKSQVWKGLIPIPGTNDRREVVLKIFFSCFHTPWWSNTWSKILDFFPEEEQAHREAWAYSRLKDVQGTRIPKSYGFYKVRVPLMFIYEQSLSTSKQIILPSKETVCVHVMEQISGPRLDSDEFSTMQEGFTDRTKTSLVSAAVYHC